jgi:hypothetical protein
MTSVCVGQHLLAATSRPWADLWAGEPVARATHQLTAIKVAILKKPGLYPDGLGLYLRITDGGGKAWIYRFMANGKTRDMGLGPLAVGPLARARQIADECRR